MKKSMTMFCALSVALVLGSACANSENKEGADAVPENKETVDFSANPDYQKGLTLVANSGCLTCHKIEEKLNGPAYKTIAQKYAGSDTAVAYLGKKIISGGSGVWGAIPMTPHPHISQADAEAIAKYILLLK